MKIPTALVSSGIVGLALFVAQPLQAQSDGCGLLKPAEVTPLLGASPVGKPVGSGCSWTAAGSTKKLIVIKPRTGGPAAETAFAGARNNAAREGTAKVTDEPGIGDKAFTSLTSFGVAAMMLKGGRLLQLQYWTGADGTAKDRDALRPVAKAAIAAF
ncbi:MAG: hypothetical protein ABI647_20680 [Gemmatimonadota bacterium]